MVIAMTVVKSGSFQTYVESQDVLRRVCIWGVKEEPSMPSSFCINNWRGREWRFGEIIRSSIFNTQGLAFPSDIQAEILRRQPNLRAYSSGEKRHIGEISISDPTTYK